MPDPIRTTLILPPALLDDEHVAETKAEGASTWEPLPLLGVLARAGGTEVEAECVSTWEPLPMLGGAMRAAVGADVGGTCRGVCLADISGTEADAPPAGVGAPRLGMPLQRDPYGRDGSSSMRRLETKNGWSVEPLAKYLKGVALQIDTNLRDECLPSAERLETFVSRLVSHSKKQLKHAPRKDRHTLQALFSSRFQKFWDFAQNQKVRSTSPEELKWALVTLVENLFAEFAGSPDTFLLAQPKPICRRHSLKGRIFA